MSGNSSFTSPSLMPLSISDWICVSRPMYSTSEDSSMLAASSFNSPSMPCFSSGVAALYSRSACVNRLTSAAAC